MFNKEWMTNIIALLSEYITKKQQWSWKVIDFLLPQELLKSIDLSL